MTSIFKAWIDGPTEKRSPSQGDVSLTNGRAIAGLSFSQQHRREVRGKGPRAVNDLGSGALEIHL
jgi:hypothetical protein